MSYIPIGDQNPLVTADGQARVLNAVLEQLCLLRAELGAVQVEVLPGSHRCGKGDGDLSQGDNGRANRFRSMFGHHSLSEPIGESENRKVTTGP